MPDAAMKGVMERGTVNGHAIDGRALCGNGRRLSRAVPSRLAGTIAARESVGLTGPMPGGREHGSFLDRGRCDFFTRPIAPRAGCPGQTRRRKRLAWVAIGITWVSECVTVACRSRMPRNVSGFAFATIMVMESTASIRPSCCRCLRRTHSRDSDLSIAGACGFQFSRRHRVINCAGRWGHQPITTKNVLALVSIETRSTAVPANIRTVTGGEVEALWRFHEPEKPLRVDASGAVTLRIYALGFGQMNVWLSTGQPVQASIATSFPSERDAFAIAAHSRQSRSVGCPTVV